MYSWPGHLDLLFGCKMAVLAKKIRYRLKKLPVQVHLCIFSLIIIYVLVWFRSIQEIVLTSVLQPANLLLCFCRYVYYSFGIFAGYQYSLILLFGQIKKLCATWLKSASCSSIVAATQGSGETALDVISWWTLFLRISMTYWSRLTNHWHMLSISSVSASSKWAISWY